MFDYVIVGAGSAGCVLAGRLSEAGHRVALLEAGGRDNKLEVGIPAAFTKLFKTKVDWAYDTVPQPALGGRSLFWPRGKMLGGCSSMNAQMWLRGYPADYDGWARAGNAGWDWSSVRDCFMRAERCEGAAGDRGAAGPLFVEQLRDPSPISFAFLDACAELGLPKLDDLNAARPEGYGMTPVTQHRGRRFSAADGYLKPALGRPGLTVFQHAHARRVVIERGRAVGVEYQDKAGRVRRVDAAKEVLLASGAIGSPQLLQLSGIGDKHALRELDIPVIADLPGVGRNLQDHLLTVDVRACPKPITLVGAESIGNLLAYLFRRKGMLTSNVGEAVAFIRSRPGLSEPDVELIFAPVPFIDHGQVKPAGHGISIGVVLLQPESRGRIALASADPLAAPRIDPGYLSDPGGHDLATIMRGMRFAERLWRAPSLASFTGAPIEPSQSELSDAQLEAFIREQCETLYHPVGTCRMGDDDGAVVDATLAVHGIAGLRVVDASVMPRIPRGHTHAPTVMIAERACELIAGVQRGVTPVRAA